MRQYQKIQIHSLVIKEELGLQQHSEIVLETRLGIQMNIKKNNNKE